MNNQSSLKNRFFVVIPGLFLRKSMNLNNAVEIKEKTIFLANF